MAVHRRKDACLDLRFGHRLAGEALHQYMRRVDEAGRAVAAIWSLCAFAAGGVGALLKCVEDSGEADNTIVIFTTDNGAEVFTWPDGGMTPFKGTKGTVMEGGFRAPAIIRWPGKVKAGTVENGIFSALDWFPMLLAAAGDSDITHLGRLPSRRREAHRLARPEKTGRKRVPGSRKRRSAY
jgi:arylsulfatase A-like enzyme